MKMIVVQQKFVYLFLLFTLAVCQVRPKIDLIAACLNEYHYKSIVYFNCWTDKENLELIKSTHKWSVKTAVFPVEGNSSIFSTQNEVTFVLDLDCPNAFDVLKKDSSSKKFRSIHHWLLLCSNRTFCKDVPGKISGVNLRLDTDVKLAIFEKNFCKIFEIYKAGIGVALSIQFLGEFFNKTLKLNSKSFYESRKSLEGVLIRTGSGYKLSFGTDEDVARERRTRGYRTFDKFNYQLFLCLKSIHKFEYNTTYRNAYFGNTTEGIDAGVAQLLYEETVDMSVSGGFIRDVRIDYYDFLVPVYKFRTCFIFVNPGYVKPGAEVLKPFASNTWCLFIISGLAIGISINLAFWIEYIFGKINTKYSLCTSMVITISVLTQQGSSIVPFGTAGRIIYLNLLIFSIIIYNYYTSSLVSSLLSSKPDAISTIKELYESNLKVVVEKRPYTLTYILQQKNDRYIDLLNRTKIFENDEPNYLPPMEGIAKVRSGTHAYHTDDVTAYFLLDKEDQELVCDLAEVNLIQNSDIGMVLQKYSQYTELFQISLRKMQTSGVYHREKTFWIPRKPVCLLTTRVKAVGINELSLVYLILCCGVFLAIFILCLEIISSRFSNFRFCYDTRRHKHV